MKNIKGLLLFTVLLSCSIANAQIYPHKTDVEQENLTGKVKSVITYVYYNSPETNNDKKRKPGEEPKYTEKTLVKYNSAGNNVEMYHFQQNKKDFVQRDSFIYDTLGRLAEKRNYDRKGRLPHKSLYKYNDKGDVTGVTHIDKIDTMNEMSVFTYENETQTELVQDMKGNLRAKYVTVFDKSGNMIESDVYNRGGKLESRQTFTYNDKGLMISSRQFEGSNSVAVDETRKYNQKGDLILTTSIVNKQKPDNYAVTYDAVDANGNWLKRQGQLRGSLVVNVTERVIEYY